MPDLKYSEEAFRDMYEALKEAEDWFTDMHANIPLHGRISRIIEQAKAKAEGKPDS